jgi:hypothetical protein
MMSCRYQASDSSKLVYRTFCYIKFEFEVMQIGVPVFMHKIVFEILIEHEAGGYDQIEFSCFGCRFGVHYIKPHL